MKKVLLVAVFLISIFISFAQDNSTAICGTKLALTQEKDAGKKITALGHDGEPVSKSKSLNKMTSLLKEPGYYLEVSGKLQDILLAKGAPVVKDKDLIQKVLKGKTLEFNEDGTYQRFIGGEKHTKTLLGKPL